MSNSYSLPAGSKNLRKKYSRLESDVVQRLFLIKEKKDESSEDEVTRKLNKSGESSVQPKLVRVTTQHEGPMC